MKFNFDEVLDRTGTQSVKGDELPKGIGANPLSMGIADMDFRVPQPITDALHDRINQGILGYTVYDSPEVKSAITGWYAKRFGWIVDPSDIYYSGGIVPALGALLRILTKEGDGVVIQRPVYYPFSNMIRSNHRHIVNSPLKNTEGYYTMDYADLEEKLSQPENTLMMLCSPHNPVGRVWHEEELRKVVEIAKKYNTWIIADEIHFDLLKTGVVHTPLAKLCPDYAHKIITCTAPSKTFNVAGMQLSNIVLPKGEVQELWKEIVMKQQGMHDCGVLATTMVIAAYNHCEDWLTAAKLYIDENFAVAEKFFKEEMPEAVMSPREGTYLLWVDFRAYCDDAQKLEKIMLEAGLSLDEGYIFGDEGAGFERVNIACTRAVLVEALGRLKRALLGSEK